ncbi:hypothetical protein BRC86_01520 [Halobacteriales archaeon QS_3_64_16]|nr:MAG: hypothetical protein BRC86_01520 [Halobacteriales archaeon QS_3_64_16]
MRRTDTSIGETDAEIERTETDGTRETSERGGRLLGRRRYLRLSGAAIASAATLAATSGSAAAASCERVVVEAGETERRTIKSGETLSNVLFDVSADGATLEVNATGSEWAIRNVGVLGTYNGADPDSVFRLEVEAGGTSVFENVYLGDGAVDDGYSGVFVPTEHAGTLTIRRCNVQEWPDNGVYASAPGREERNGQGGAVQIEDSYAQNNNKDGFRLGTDGSYVRGSVVYVNGDVPDSNAGLENARGIWVKEGGTVDIENCDILLADPDGSYCVWEDKDRDGLARVIDSQVMARDGAEGRFVGNVETTDVGDDPDVTPPDGVPMSAEEACTAEGTDTTDWKELTFDGLGTDIPFAYSVSVTGDIEKAESNPGDNADSVAGNTATGGARLKQDVYRYTGSITTLEIDFQNGQTVSLDRSDSRVSITGPSNGRTTQYTIAVAEDITKVGPENPGDEIDRGRVAGVVSTAGDTYRYSGGLEAIDIDGVSMVRVTPT